MHSVVEYPLTSARQHRGYVRVAHAELLCQYHDNIADPMLSAIARQLEQWKHEALIIWDHIRAIVELRAFYGP